MKNNKLKKIITILGVLATLNSTCSYAAGVDPRVVNPKYLYSDDDIRNITSNRLGNKAFVSGIISQSTDIFGITHDMLDNAIGEAIRGKAALVPVNLRGAHWTALVIRKKTDGSIVVFYNDSLGNAPLATARAAIEYLKTLSGVEIIDLQVRQQTDSTSCGAFTAENLIALATLDPSKLNANEARAILATINDAKSIRWLHGGVINNLEEIANSSVTRNQVETIHSVALNELSVLSSLTHNRLSDLHLASNVRGFSSGDDDTKNYGAWVRGNLGNGSYKTSDSIKFQNKFNGVALGFDGKIAEDFTIGIAINLNTSNLKPKKNNTNILGSDYKGLIGGLYGSFVDREGIVYSANIEGGKVASKAHYNSVLNGKNTIKLNGQIWRTSFDVSYYTELSSIIFVPSFGLSYEKAEFDKIKQSNFNISKTTVEKFSVTPGIKLTKSFDLGAIQIIPAISAATTYAPFAEASKITVRSNNGFILSDGKMPTVENSHNIGASLGIASQNIEASLGYEKIIQNKYHGQIGYLKLRVNF